MYREGTLVSTELVSMDRKDNIRNLDDVVAV
jgi:hypothetical protein